MAFKISNQTPFVTNNPPKEKIRIKSILACAWGNALELFDVQVYTHVFMVISPIFFPTDSASMSALFGILDSLFEFIGGVVYGQLGDTIGRKSALINSLIFVIVPTAIIGILPTYQQIGMETTLD